MSPEKISKRRFLKTTGGVFLGTLISPAVSWGSSQSSEHMTKVIGQFNLPDLPYSYDALEPYIDEQTMRIHHTKHHAGYTKKLNAAIELLPRFKDRGIVDILETVTSEKDQEKVRQNGGGYFNHSLFWNIMSPKVGGKPSGVLLDKIDQAFGSYENFVSEFKGAAGSVFGSGWAWLSKNQEGNLFISSTANQDNPLMSMIVDEPGKPILGVDIWEHAYYLKYQNKRSEYIDSFFQVINWNQVSKNLL